jgi:hypothetical protein
VDCHASEVSSADCSNSAEMQRKQLLQPPSTTYTTSTTSTTAGTLSHLLPRRYEQRDARLVEPAFSVEVEYDSDDHRMAGADDESDVEERKESNARPHRRRQFEENGRAPAVAAPSSYRRSGRTSSSPLTSSAAAAAAAAASVSASISSAPRSAIAASSHGDGEQSCEEVSEHSESTSESDDDATLNCDLLKGMLDVAYKNRIREGIFRSVGGSTRVITTGSQHAGCLNFS